jgi:hypothetical protein
MSETTASFSDNSSDENLETTKTEETTAVVSSVTEIAETSSEFVPEGLTDIEENMLRIIENYISEISDSVVIYFVIFSLIDLNFDGSLEFVVGEHYDKSDPCIYVYDLNTTEKIPIIDIRDKMFSTIKIRQNENIEVDYGGGDPSRPFDHTIEQSRKVFEYLFSNYYISDNNEKYFVLPSFSGTGMGAYTIYQKLSYNEQKRIFELDIIEDEPRFDEKGVIKDNVPKMRFDYNPFDENAEKYPNNFKVYDFYGVDPNRNDKRKVIIDGKIVVAVKYYLNEIVNVNTEETTVVVSSDVIKSE